jgi:hypothetical protein
MSKTATTHNSGYKKRLMHRNSGNPGPAQMWVKVGDPGAARASSPKEIAEYQALMAEEAAAKSPAKVELHVGMQ